MKLFVRHELNYRYTGPVSLAPHVLHLHPPTNAHLRVDRYELRIEPEPEKLVAGTDVEGNHQHVFFHGQPTDFLNVTAEMNVETLLKNPFDFLFHPTDAQRMPFQYPENLKRVLHPYLVAEGVTTLVEQFARQVAAEADWQTLPFLTRLNETIRHGFAYEIRETGHPMPPEHVLIQRKGSCRDYVSLYLAACRVLGLAARFVSGYYFGVLKEHQHLHAWAEVYLPGAGWRGFDPTQNCAVADRHVPLAASAVPRLVTPTLGGFAHKGGISSHLHARVEVRPISVEVMA